MNPLKKYQAMLEGIQSNLVKETSLKNGLGLMIGSDGVLTYDRKIMCEAFEAIDKKQDKSLV